MNLRFITFVAITSLSLFFLNQYLVPTPKDKGPKVEAVSESVDSIPTIGIGNLPLYPLYKTEAASDNLSYGLEVSKGTYLLPKGALTDPAKELFVKNNKGLIKKVGLINKDSSKEKCLIYSEIEKPTIKTVAIPTGKAFLTLLQIEETAPFAFPAILENGKLTLGQEQPTSSCLAIYDDMGDFFVLGIYDPAHSQLTPFSAIGSLDDMIDYVPTSAQKGPLSSQQLYVLENESIQLVFSTTGGSICEVNLPIKSESHPNSVILPVDEDKILSRQAPLSDQFPMTAYKISVNGRLEVMQPAQGGYYPLIRRGTAKKDPRAISKALPKFYTANVISTTYPEIANLPYQLTSISDKRIVFTGRHQGTTIKKTFELPESGEKAPYVVLASIEVSSPRSDLYLTSGVPEVEFVGGVPNPGITYLAYDGTDLKANKFKLPKTVSSLEGVTPDWTANSNGYFATIIDPLDKVRSGMLASYVPGEVDPSRITLIDVLSDRYPASKYPGYQVAVPLSANGGTTDFRLFLGPLDADVLKKVDAFYTNEVTGYSPEYNKAIMYQGFLSVISEPFARLLSILMQFCYTVTRSWGFSIILLTILLRLILYPLNAWSIRSTIGMKLAQPELSKVQARYKNDPMKLRAETMKVYKQYSVNPLGCIIPLFLQMPFLFGIYSVMKTSFGIRGASFIPGWINNLSSPDTLISWGVSIPFIGSSLHALPILSALLMYFQTKQSAKKNDTSKMSDMEQQQQKMSFMMPLVMLVVFYNMPAGLNIYFISSSVLQVLQQHLTQRSMEKKQLKKNPKEVIVEPKQKRKKK